jgi:hypothetical protein
MDFETIRRTVIVAAFSDPVLVELLVVKGGNALRLVHGIGSRTSLDVDFSTPGLLDEKEVGTRLERALSDRFDSAGLFLFDFALKRRPEAPVDPVQAGYEATFKVIPKGKARAYRDDLERLRREASTIGPDQQRAFFLQVSAHEFCDGAEEVELDDFVVRVYTPAMIAVEKYRAICQQHPSYKARAHKTARARDFLDIHSIVVGRGVDLGNGPNRQLFSDVFAAKNVPLALLREIEGQREFHRADWPSVGQSALGPLEPFDFYFDFAVARIPAL